SPSTEDLHSLTDLANLESLQLQDRSRDLTNPICLSAGYADKILDLLPQLSCLDGIRVRGSGDSYYQLCRQIDQALSGGSNSPSAAAGASSSDGASSSGLGEAFWSLDASVTAALAETAAAETEFAEAVARLRDRELQTMLCLEEWDRELKKRKV
uniref:HRDC domain-containing protein n=1 Tax=Macrostomum lignano TaxID=282301 RepID=A0A1I8GYU6_9PLAT